MSTRLSITLTDQQAEQLDAIAAETGATRQSMIGLAVSQWIRQQRRQWYGYALVTDRDPLSGEIDTYSIGYDGPFPTEEQARRHAERIAAANIADGIQAVAVTEHE